MPLSRTGATATLLAVAACAVALVAVSEAAPAVVGSFEDLIGKVQRPWAVSPGAFPRNAERVPCFLSESDELSALMEPLEPLGDDLPSLDAAEVEAALTPISPRADTSVPVYRGSSVGSKAWYRGVAARDEDADDNPTRMSLSLFLEEQEPLLFPILGVGEVLAKDGIKVVSLREYSDVLANDVTEDPIEDPVEDDTEDLPKANEFPVEETTENLDKESSGVFRNLPILGIGEVLTKDGIKVVSLREYSDVLANYVTEDPVEDPVEDDTEDLPKANEFPVEETTENLDKESSGVFRNLHLFSRNGYSEDFAQGFAEDLDEDTAKDLVPENVI